MKQIVLFTVLIASLCVAQAQPSVPREDALKAAFAASLDLKQMLNTPIPTDPDVKRPVVLRAEERGAMVLPEGKLSAEVLAKAGKEVVAVGQLWLRKAALMCGTQRAKPDKVQAVAVGNGDLGSVTLSALGLRKDDSGKLELLIYGKDKEPLLALPLKSITTRQDNPIEMTGELQGDGALITLKILGKYEARFTLVPD